MKKRIVTKKLKKLASILILCSLLITVLSGCNSTDNKSESGCLKFYSAEDDGDLLLEAIIKYNKYCSQNLDDSYKIEIVEFENANEMYTKMSAELMAGKGPDLLSVGQTLPFEKLMLNNALCNINELIDSDHSSDKLDLSDYNSTIMNAGMFNGKQYIIPFFYGTDLLVSNEETLKKFNLPAEQGKKVTYSEIDTLFDDFFKDQKNTAFLFGDSDSFFSGSDELFSRFIYKYIDFENKKTYFNTEEFKSQADSMCKILESRNSVTQDQSLGNYLFDILYIGNGFTSMANRYYYSKSSPVIYNGFLKNDSDSSAFIQMGVAVNQNSEFKDKAYKFIKYMLSETAQEYFCGDSDTNFAGLANVSFPVRNEAFENSVKKAYETEYEISSDEIIIEVSQKNELEEEENKKYREFLDVYVDLIKDINQCNIYPYTINSYYYKNVISDICHKYFNGEITKEKFILWLTSATNIYLSE